MVDRNTKGRQWRPSGELAPKAKLTNQEATIVRERYSRGETEHDLAAEYGLHVKSMRRVLRGEVYR